MLLGILNPCHTTFVDKHPSDRCSVLHLLHLLLILCFPDKWALRPNFTSPDKQYKGSTC